jgi:hypothetical protein
MKERKAFLLRLSPDLWSDVEAWAQDDLRSVNSQIEYLLREAVQRRKGRGGGSPAPPGTGPAAPRSRG